MFPFLKVHSCLKALSADFKAQYGLDLLDAVLQFIIDDNEHIWLSQISKITCKVQGEEIDQHESDILLPLPSINSRPSSSQVRRKSNQDITKRKFPNLFLMYHVS